MHWLIDPWTTPKLQMTALQDLVMGMEILFAVALLFAVAYLVGRAMGVLK